MAKFRKKPVVIEAVQFDGSTEALCAISDFGHDVVLNWQADEPDYLLIPTLEGEMRANIGDWIIKGVKGEIYPCKPEVFAATYEPAE